MKESKFIATKYDKDWEKETLKFDYQGEKGLDQKLTPFPFLCFHHERRSMIMDLQEHISPRNLHTHVRMRD